MPRYQQKHSVTIPRPVFDEIISRCHDPEHRPLHAVLAGKTTEHNTALELVITDDDPDRATKRAHANQHDLDVVGNASITYDSLDQTIARTTEEQAGRRQTNYTPPEGHVFLHVNHIAGYVVLNASVIHHGNARQAVVHIDDPEKLRPRRARKKPPTADQS